jgi:hypothetical protein
LGGKLTGNPRNKGRSHARQEGSSFHRR